MAKKKVTEEVTEVSKVSNRQKKEAIKAARKTEKEANAKLRKDFEEKIDKKNEELKELKKNKASKEDIKATKKEISSLRKDRSNVGKVKNETFMGDVVEELKLVRWPSKMEVVKYSIATLVFVGFFALFFTLIDVLFALVKGWLS
jgi:preprotein translocase SecE subunit